MKRPTVGGYGSGPASRGAPSVALTRPSRQSDAARAAGITGLYADRLNGRRVCLRAVLVAEYETLPEPMRRAIDRFFSDSEEWLATVLERGRAGGSLSFEALPRDTAGMIIGGLVGAMLLARSNNDVNRFRSAARLLLATVGG